MASCPGELILSFQSALVGLFFFFFFQIYEKYDVLVL